MNYVEYVYCQHVTNIVRRTMKCYKVIKTNLCSYKICYVLKNTAVIRCPKNYLFLIFESNNYVSFASTIEFLCSTLKATIYKLNEVRGKQDLIVSKE
jgi:hypothetical protein